MTSRQVILTIEPWVNGTRMQSYWGPLLLNITVTGASWEEGIDSILEAAAEAARARGCNAVVGIEIECDPYHKNGGRIELKGTVAQLEPLFADVTV